MEKIGDLLDKVTNSFSSAKAGDRPRYCGGALTFRNMPDGSRRDVRRECNAEVEVRKGTIMGLCASCSQMEQDFRDRIKSGEMATKANRGTPSARNDFFGQNPHHETSERDD